MNLDNLKPNAVIMILFALVAVILPAFLFLFLFDRELFFALSEFKLSVVALGIASPYIIANAMIAWYYESLKSLETDDALVLGLLTCIYVAFVFYVTLLAGCIFNLTLSTGLGIASGLQVMIFLFVLVQNRSKKNQMPASTVENAGAVSD